MTPNTLDLTRFAANEYGLFAFGLVAVVILVPVIAAVIFVAIRLGLRGSAAARSQDLERQERIDLLQSETAKQLATAAATLQSVTTQQREVTEQIRGTLAIASTLTRHMERTSDRWERLLAIDHEQRVRQGERSPDAGGDDGDD